MTKKSSKDFATKIGYDKLHFKFKEDQKAFRYEISIVYSRGTYANLGELVRDKTSFDSHLSDWQYKACGGALDTEKMGAILQTMIELNQSLDMSPHVVGKKEYKAQNSELRTENWIYNRKDKPICRFSYDTNLNLTFDNLAEGVVLTDDFVQKAREVCSKYLPPLKGTEKQVAWAEKIRSWARREEGEKIRSKELFATEATWWIKNKKPEWKPLPKRNFTQKSAYSYSDYDDDTLRDLDDFALAMVDIYGGDD